MRSFNKVIVIGNLVRDPSLKYLPSGLPACNFSIALNDSYKKGDEMVENVSYLDVAVFSKQAENCNEYLSKGRTVLIEGRLQQRRWEAKDGTKKSKVEIVASNVMFLGSGEKKAQKKEPDYDNDFETIDNDEPLF